MTSFLVRLRFFVTALLFTSPMSIGLCVYLKYVVMLLCK